MLSHLTPDLDPEGMHAVIELYRTQTGVPLRSRTYAEIAALLQGLDLVEPGLVLVHRWRSDRTERDLSHDDARIGSYGAVARIHVAAPGRRRPPGPSAPGGPPSRRFGGPENGGSETGAGARMNARPQSRGRVAHRAAGEHVPDFGPRGSGPLESRPRAAGASRPHCGRERPRPAWRLRELLRAVLCRAALRRVGGLRHRQGRRAALHEPPGGLPLRHPHATA